MKKKNILIIALVVVLVVLAGLVLGMNKKFRNKVSDNKITINNTGYKKEIVASNFASYDFLRAILKGTKDIKLTFLLGPGKDAHSYDPTAQDIVKMENADALVYIGGTMEAWSDKVVKNLEGKNKIVVKISDFTDKLKEEEIDGAEPDDDDDDEGPEAFDEHIWTSPANAIKMLNELKNLTIKLDPENAKKYEENASKYEKEIQNVDNEIKKVVDNKKRDRLVFGDKMPMQYFIKYYNLKVSAAFCGCSTETEPSAKTISYLAKLVKQDNIPVVLYIELNDGKVAKAIAKEAGNGAKAMQIQTLHNLSLDDFNKNETWVSLMKKNVEVLRKALD